MTKEQIIASSERLSYDDDDEWNTWGEDFCLDEDEIAVTVLDCDFIKI